MTTYKVFIIKKNRTSGGATQSKRFQYFQQILPQKNKKIEYDPILLQGEGIKIIIPSSNFDIWTRLEIIVGVKLTSIGGTLI